MSYYSMSHYQHLYDQKAQERAERYQARQQKAFWISTGLNFGMQIGGMIMDSIFTKKVADEEVSGPSTQNTKTTKTTKSTPPEESNTITDEQAKKDVDKILNDNRITVDAKIRDKVAQKYKTMKAIENGNISVEQRVVNYAKALVNTSKAQKLTTSVVSSRTLLEACNIKDQDDINKLLSEGSITNEQAQKLKLALEQAQTTEVINIEGVNEALAKNDMEGFKNAYRSIAVRMIETYDTDNDGEISATEYIAEEKRASGKNFNQENCLTIFSTLDRNNDNSLDQNEMASLIWAASKFNDTETEKSASTINADEVYDVTSGLTDIANGTHSLNSDKLIEALKNGYKAFKE